MPFQKSLKNFEGETISSLLKKADIKTKEFLTRDLNAQWIKAMQVQPMKFEADEAQQNQPHLYEDAKI